MEAFDISEDSLKLLSRDGRFLSKPVELSVAKKLGLAMNTNSNGGFDLQDLKTGRKFEVRLVTESGTFLAQNSMRGAGRSFDLRRFVDWIARLDGFLFVDCTRSTWSDMEESYLIYQVSRDCVMSWFQGLKRNTHLSLKKFHQLIDNL